MMEDIKLKTQELVQRCYSFVCNKKQISSVSDFRTYMNTTYQFSFGRQLVLQEINKITQYSLIIEDITYLMRKYIKSVVATQKQKMSFSVLAANLDIYQVSFVNIYLVAYYLPKKCVLSYENGEMFIESRRPNLTDILFPGNVIDYEVIKTICKTNEQTVEDMIMKLANAGFKFVIKHENKMSFFMDSAIKKILTDQTGAELTKLRSFGISLFDEFSTTIDTDQMIKEYLQKRKEVLHPAAKLSDLRTISNDISMLMMFIANSVSGSTEFVYS